MLIADILRAKGSSVVTCGGTDTVTSLLARLADHKIGAVVVTEGTRIVGIVSERDVVRAINRSGPAVLSAPVSDLMTSPVICAAPGDSINDIASQMTNRRIRHMPVQVSGELAGIVTIGDVVAARIRELEQTRGQLENYITGG